MPTKVQNHDLRLRAQYGDISAAVELFERCRPKTLKGALAQVADFEAELTPALFDVAADAWAIYQRKKESA